MPARPHDAAGLRLAAGEVGERGGGAAVIQASTVSVKTMALPKRVIDLAGRTFGKLTVLEFAGSQNGSLWKCLCECGSETIKQARVLPKLKSCGCEQTKAMHAARKKHGARRDPVLRKLYAAWQGMHARCRNPMNKAFKYYGGRGIAVCARWSEFSTFLADMGMRPEGMTLDRINPNGNYEPSNCKWASWSEQRHNRRDSRE